VSFAVIPEAALDTPGPDGGREGILSPETAGRTGMQVLTPETPVSAWLRRHAGQVDVFMHGLSHARVRANTEFGALDAAEAKARLALGLATITSALDRRPVGFVAPWDELS
jgi:hypothetical protein